MILTNLLSLLLGHLLIFLHNKGASKYNVNLILDNNNVLINLYSLNLHNSGLIINRVIRLGCLVHRILTNANRLLLRFNLTLCQHNILILHVSRIKVNIYLNELYQTRHRASRANYNNRRYHRYKLSRACIHRV